MIKHYGLTFKQKYLSSRISLASTLLKNAGLLGIDEIAEKLKFSSRQQFSKSFKEDYDISPAQYRRDNSDI